MQWSLFLLSLMGHCSLFTCHLYEYHFINENKTWKEAQTYCRDNYTDLATVFDMTDMERLRDSTEEHGGAWIGLYNEGGREWHWSLPGVEFKCSQAKWADGEPNDKGQQENCVMMDRGKWKDAPCNETFHFICYDDKVILIKEEKTWTEALYYCREKHRDLVSITNLAEQTWVQEKAKNAKTGFVWLGLRYTCTLDLWFWISDEIVCYENWASDEKKLCDRCAAMKKKGKHKWQIKAETEKFNFFCTL